MSVSSGIAWPSALEALPKPLALGVRRLVPSLLERLDIDCLLWGGSTSSGEVRDFADVDLWLIVPQVEPAVETLRELVKTDRAVVLVNYAGYYPWFGELTTAFYSADGALSIDVGVASVKDVPTLNPGPRPHLLWGKRAFLSDLGAGIDEPSPSDRLVKLTVNLVKVRKALARGHLWNAVAYLTAARNEVLGVARYSLRPPGCRYSRPEHSAETWLDSSLGERLAATHPILSRRDIARSACLLGEIACAFGESIQQRTDWLLVLDNALAELRRVATL